LVVRTNLFQEILQRDPSELPLAIAVYERRTDLGAVERYEAYLAARGDARAELFALERKAATRGGPERDAVVVRLKKLLDDAEMRAFWEVFSGESAIRSCGKSAGAAPAIRFVLECPMTWGALAITESPNVRRCHECRELVYLCRSREEAEQRARQGSCITVPRALAHSIQSELATHVTGRPDVVRLWSQHIFANEPER
jgi:hypothetical protein